MLLCLYIMRMKALSFAKALNTRDGEQQLCLEAASEFTQLASAALMIDVKA